MTAGKGIIHTEEITSKQKLRLLQVWLVLPPEKRYAEPFLQKILLEEVPKIKTDTYEIRVDSGNSNRLTSPVKTHTTFTLVDFGLEEKAVVTQHIPSHYRSLVYVLTRRVSAGDKSTNAEQAGWLDKTVDIGNTEIQFEPLESKTSFVLFSGQLHNVPVVHRGPFV